METEAYIGPGDRACHAWGGKRTPRTEILFGEAGHAYVYLIYGMYCCLNVVTGLSEEPQCVLIRALRPCAGLDIMTLRRGGKPEREDVRRDGAAVPRRRGRGEKRGEFFGRRRTGDDPAAGIGRRRR